jgi:hypothetical protein
MVQYVPLNKLVVKDYLDLWRKEEKGREEKRREEKTNIRCIEWREPLASLVAATANSW